jgi:hypothetical protein
VPNLEPPLIHPAFAAVLAQHRQPPPARRSTMSVVHRRPQGPDSDAPPGTAQPISRAPEAAPTVRVQYPPQPIETGRGASPLLLGLVRQVGRGETFERHAERNVLDDPAAQFTRRPPPSLSPASTPTRSAPPRSSRHLPLAVIASGDGSSRSGLAGERTGRRLWCVSRLGRCDGEGPASRCSRCSSRPACQAESKPRT